MLWKTDLEGHRVIVVGKVGGTPGNNLKRSAHSAALVFLGGDDEADAVFHGRGVQAMFLKPGGIGSHPNR